MHEYFRTIGFIFPTVERLGVEIVGERFSNLAK